MRNKKLNQNFQNSNDYLALGSLCPPPDIVLQMSLECGSRPDSKEGLGTSFQLLDIFHIFHERGTQGLRKK